jgi:hypothetical protein
VWLGENKGDSQLQEAVNVEVCQNESSVAQLQVGGNLSHMNLYKRLPVVSRPFIYNTTTHRQAALDRHPAPTNIGDVQKILGDTTDPDYPIYRSITLVTYIIEKSSAAGDEATIRIWAHTNPAKSKPVYEWNTKHFFDY